MDYDYQPKQSTGRYVGIGAVIVLHIVIAWALASGMARKAVEVIKKPLEAVVIQEVVLPPPPPPPPPPKIEPPKVAPPKVQAPPPPPFVPPPEVTPPPAPEAAPVIQAVQAPPPAPPAIEPPPPPAPPAPQPAAAKPDIGVACPVQARPEIPLKALQSGQGGTVRAEVTIRGGAVADVRILSGPRMFHAPVREALRQYKCTAADGTVAVQDFDFKIE